MNRLLKNTFFLILLLGLTTCAKERLETTASVLADEEISFRNHNERVVVANRASRSISVIDAATNTLIGTYPMPDNGEPMYVVHVPRVNAVFVGDRANNRVVVFDESDFSVLGFRQAGAGVFHMWANPIGTELWVNNDIDNTTTVIHPGSTKVKATVATPADLVAQGGKPHDVFYDPVVRAAYVSVLGNSGPNDYIVKYGGFYTEVGRVAVGKDPHLFADDANNLLYVPCQGTGELYVLDRNTLNVQAILPFSGAHGIFMTGSGDYAYVGNISGAMIGLFDTNTNSQVGAAVSTPFSTPHNLVINTTEDKLFVTHSGGTADKLSIYSLNPAPTLMTSITVGLNPFGLAYYRY
ncbi:MAG: hypothetical protein DHS20C18_25760 [Saprospiraceae bacterium]|nr:MAG: hypothetical protein DHS20C18_25760 [Saprospiraceae bacterium]